MKKKLFVIADSPTASTGFATVTKNVLANLPKSWDIHILGVNYHGDPHPLQAEYTIYPPSIGGDVYGFGRIPHLIKMLNPDMIWILNDPWLCAEYVLGIRKIGYKGPIVLYTPIDSPAIKPEYVLPLNNANHVITYTDWALSELRKTGLTTQASVIPHGVDLTHFTPVDKMIARKELFKDIGFNYENAFIVLYTGRNQPRKRVDLFPYIFRKWINKYPHDNVYMHYHGAVKGDLGNDIEYISHYFGVDDRLILTSRELSVTNPLPIERLKFVYSAPDVYLQICAVEGLAN